MGLDLLTYTPQVPGQLPRHRWGLDLLLLLFLRQGKKRRSLKGKDKVINKEIPEALF